MITFLKKPNVSLFLAVSLGIFAGFSSRLLESTGFSPAVALGIHEQILASANVVSSIFINLLKLVSLPIIFLSIVSTASGMDSVKEIKFLGIRVIKYTLFTTLIAATVALGIYVAVDPVRTPIVPLAEEVAASQNGYLHYLLQSIPSNFLQPFVENSVIGVLFLAMILSFAILSLPEDKRKVLNTFFSSLYAAVMKITQGIIKLMPFAIWSFVTLFIKDLHGGLEMESLVYYLFCVVAANLVQAAIVLPTLLKAKGVRPVALFRAMMPALSVAFFSKSSSAALPMAMECAEKRGGVSAKVASFSLPLCTTINMNACAAFILTTVLFVSTGHGVIWTWYEMIVWILIATIAAVGNAGVPMGCYFLASAFLAAMNVPLNVLGVILPFYSLIDMLESAINVWSDSCVTALVDHELATEQETSLQPAVS